MENNHKTWLDNEYNQWVKALQESTVHNFKEHPVVKRMLGWIDGSDFAEAITHKVLNGLNLQLFGKIEGIGWLKSTPIHLGTTLRMIYYALEILKRNPTSICEIGGGVGQFYAILRALGYKGRYLILDIPEVQEFQFKYLSEVSSQTGLNIDQFGVIGEIDLVVSFYSLGEFDNETKEFYFNPLINDIPHGYIAWNPHSGATDDLSLFRHDIKVTPGIEEGIKIITW